MSDSSIQGQMAKATGGSGGIRVDGSGSNTGVFFAIQAIEATSIESGTEGNIDGLIGAALPAGMIVYGDFSVVSASGDYILYKNI